MNAKQPFELECRQCGQRFLEMVKLLFHRCPGLSDAHRGPQSHERRAGTSPPTHGHSTTFPVRRVRTMKATRKGSRLARGRSREL